MESSCNLNKSPEYGLSSHHGGLSMPCIRVSYFWKDPQQIFEHESNVITSELYKENWVQSGGQI